MILRTNVPVSPACIKLPIGVGGFMVNKLQMCVMRVCDLRVHGAYVCGIRVYGCVVCGWSAQVKVANVQCVYGQ